MDGVNLRQKVFVRMLARYCHFQKKKSQMKPTQLMQWKSRRICISRQKYYAKQNLNHGGVEIEIKRPCTHYNLLFFNQVR